MSIRLIATDLDGTLLKNDHRTVPERSREALRLAAESGVLTAIASGRTAGLLRDVAAQVPQVRYAVIFQRRRRGGSAHGRADFQQADPV